jgi:hypothetical protein
LHPELLLEDEGCTYEASYLLLTVQVPILCVQSQEGLEKAAEHVNVLKNNSENKGISE